MGKCERARMHDPEEDGIRHTRRAAFPADFSAEEREFASALRDLFPVDQEELPPYFTQTLLENPRQAPAAPGYEHKVVYSVFRQLNLPRPPLAQRRRLVPSWSTISSSLAQTSRPILGAVAAFILLIVLSMVLATPSFASGLRLLLLGRTGVEQVHHYPVNVGTSNYTPSGWSVSVNTPNEPIYWLGPSVGKYQYQGMRLLDNERWSNGPLVEVRYAIPGLPDTILDLREFQPAPRFASVLQVVQDGSATQVTIGNSSAIYVNGNWATALPNSAWNYGTRGELIFQQGATIIWMVASPGSSASENALASMAAQLSRDVPRPNAPHVLVGTFDAHSPVFAQDVGTCEVYALAPMYAVSQGDDNALVRVRYTPVRGRATPA